MITKQEYVNVKNILYEDKCIFNNPTIVGHLFKESIEKYYNRRETLIYCHIIYGNCGNWSSKN